MMQIKKVVFIVLFIKPSSTSIITFSELLNCYNVTSYLKFSSQLCYFLSIYWYKWKCFLNCISFYCKAIIATIKIINAWLLLIAVHII